MGLKTRERKELALGLYESEQAVYSKRILVETLGVVESALYYDGVQQEKDLKVKEQIEEQYKLDDTMGAGKLAPLLGYSEERVARVMLKFDIITRKKAKKYNYAGESNDVLENQLSEVHKIVPILL